MTSNALVLTQLPPHLAALAANSALSGVNAAAMAAAGGQSFHSISIRQSRWRLNDPQGQEVVLPTLHLDAIIVGVNMNKSKIWYAEAYNPASTEYKAPDCWSDNGVAPSTAAAKPQCKSCAECPHNVWGSKITPGGKQTKSCTDAIKIATLLADNHTGAVYQLRVPAASIGNLGNYAKQLNDKGVPMASLVTRLSFDTQADHPKILFNPVAYADAEQAASINEVLGTDEVNLVLGVNDKPITALAAAAPAAPLAPPAATPAPTLPPPAPTAAPVVAPAAETPKPRRTRTTQAAAVAEAAPAVAPPVSVPQPTAAPAGFFDKLQANAAQPAQPTAAAQVHTSVPAAGSSLDDLIAQAMKV